MVSYGLRHRKVGQVCGLWHLIFHRSVTILLRCRGYSRNDFNSCTHKFEDLLQEVLVDRVKSSQLKGNIEIINTVISPNKCSEKYSFNSVAKRDKVKYLT